MDTLGKNLSSVMSLGWKQERKRGGERKKIKMNDTSGKE